MSLLTNLGSILGEISQSALQIAIRTLSATPTPLGGTVSTGISIALICLLVGLVARFLCGESGSLTMDAEHPWTVRDSARLAAGVVAIGLYYLTAGAAHTVLGRLTAPFGGGDALIAALAVPNLAEVGSLLSVMVAGIGAGAAVFAAIFGLLRYLTIAILIPLVFPMLTVLGLLQLQAPNSPFRGALRRLRWIAYLGVVAVMMIQIGGTAASTAANMGLETTAFMVAAATLFLMTSMMRHLFVFGPKIEQRLGELATTFPGNAPSPEEDNEGGESDTGSADERARERALIR